MVNASQNYNRPRRPQREGVDPARKAKKTLDMMIKAAQRAFEDKRKALFRDFDEKKKARKKRRHSKNFIMRRRAKVRESNVLNDFDIFEREY